MKLARVAWIAAATLTIATAARADPPRVVLAQSNADAGAESLETRRLRSELEALGFEVVVVPLADGGARTIDDLARANGAVAAIHLVKDGLRVEVWLRDRVTGKTVVRDVEVSESDPDRAAAVLAVRAVELLRASLLETNEPHASRGDVASVPVIDAWVAPPTVSQPPAPTTSLSAWIPPTPPGHANPKLEASERRVRFGVDAAPEVAWSPGGVPATLVVDVGARVMPVPWAGPCIRSELPALASKIEGPEGSAEVHAGNLLFGARAEPLAHVDVPLRPFVESGIGLAWVSVTGVTNTAGFARKNDDTTSAALYVRAGARLLLVGPLSLRADAGIVVAVPDVIVAFADREAASIGAPWITAGGGADLEF